MDGIVGHGITGPGVKAWVFSLLRPLVIWSLHCFDPPFLHMQKAGCWWYMSFWSSPSMLERNGAPRLCICLTSLYQPGTILIKPPPSHKETHDIRITATQGQWPHLKLCLEFKLLKCVKKCRLFPLRSRLPIYLGKGESIFSWNDFNTLLEPRSGLDNFLRPLNSQQILFISEGKGKRKKQNILTNQYSVAGRPWPVAGAGALVVWSTNNSQCAKHFVKVN